MKPFDFASAIRALPANCRVPRGSFEFMIRINGKPIWFWALAFLFFAAVLFCAWQAYSSHGQNLGLRAFPRIM
jgi:hypothetical protein